MCKKSISPFLFQIRKQIAQLNAYKMKSQQLTYITDGIGSVGSYCKFKFSRELVCSKRIRQPAGFIIEVSILNSFITS